MRKGAADPSPRRTRGIPRAAPQSSSCREVYERAGCAQAAAGGSPSAAGSGARRGGSGCAVGGSRSAAARSSCRSRSRWAAASFAARTASPGSRFFFSEATPWAARSEGGDLLDRCGDRVADRSRGSVRALGDRNSAVGDHVGLVELMVDSVDRAADLGRSPAGDRRSVPAMSDDSRPNVCPSLKSM